MKNRVQNVLEQLEKKSAELDIKLEAASSLEPVKQSFKDKIKTSVVGNNSLVFKQACGEITDAIKNQSFDQVIQSITNQTEAIENNTGKLVLAELGAMVKSLKNINDKNYFDEAAFDQIFRNSFDRVVSILQRQEEIPFQTDYKRNANGKISIVTEYYETHTVEHKWSYDSNGNLVKVRTSKNEIK